MTKNQLMVALADEAAERARLMSVLPLLVRKSAKGHVKNVRLRRMLALCGCFPSEALLTTLMMDGFDALPAKREGRRSYAGADLRPDGLSRAFKLLLKQYEGILDSEGLTVNAGSDPDYMSIDPSKMRPPVRLPADFVSSKSPSKYDSAMNVLIRREIDGDYYFGEMRDCFHGTDWSKFPAEHRTIIELHAFEGLGKLEISKRVGLSHMGVQRVIVKHRMRVGLRP